MHTENGKIRVYVFLKKIECIVDNRAETLRIACLRRTLAFEEREFQPAKLETLFLPPLGMMLWTFVLNTARLPQPPGR